MISIGEILRPHGSRGEVKVFPLTDFPERFCMATRVYLKDPGRTEPAPARVERARLHRGNVILKLEGVDSPEGAERLRGYLVQVEREELVKLPAGHYYFFQITGLKVFTEAGEFIGEVSEVFRTGSNDVYRVKREAGKDVLIPATKEVVAQIDLEGGRMLIRPIPGLLG